MMFGMVCAADYERRYATSKKLGELVSYPGLKLSSVFKSFYKSKKDDKIFIDLQNKRLLDNFDYLSKFEEIVATEKYFNLMCFDSEQIIVE